MKLRFDKWLVVGSCLVLAMIAVSAAVTYRNTLQMVNDARWVEHTLEVVNSLDDVISTLKDAETGQRGFLITGDERYLEPYHGAVAALNRRTAQIEHLTSDNARQQARIPMLRSLIQAKLDELARTIALRQVAGFESAKSEVMTGLGKNRMDAIRALVAEMRENEERLLRERRLSDERAYRTAVAGITVTALMSFASAWTLIWLLRRHLDARLRAAAILHEQQEWLRTTLRSIGDAVMATDMAGRVTFLNAVAQDLTGWEENEAKGQPLESIFRIVNEDTRAIVDSPIRRALAEGTIVGLANHTVLISKDGTESPIDDSAAPIRDKDGQVIGCVLVFRDTSVRRQQENERRKRVDQLAKAEEALQAADQRKDEFLAILAHELRNPLATMLIASELLLRDSGDADLIEESGRIMERQVKLMVRLVDDLMDVSRIAQGKIQLRKDIVDLAAVVSSAVETSRPAIDAAEHELIITLPATPIPLRADPTRLAQVFSNLLNNAAKYSERGGSVRLTAAVQPREVVVSVKDDGIGISADMLPRIFQMFTQVDRTLERSHGGLGIGLTLVKRLVELHDGTVEARSDGPGLGSEFTVRLPIYIGDEETQSPADLTAGDHDAPARRILVVDDNKDSAAALATLLNRRGHETRIAHNGLEAVVTAEQFRPHSVLLDIGLPKLNGLEACRRIREQPWGASMLLIAVSGWARDEDRWKAKDAGFDQHLGKPVDFDALITLLASAKQAHDPAD